MRGQENCDRLMQVTA